MTPKINIEIKVNLPSSLPKEVNTLLQTIMMINAMLEAIKEEKTRMFYETEISAMLDQITEILNDQK